LTPAAPPSPPPLTPTPSPFVPPTVAPTPPHRRRPPAFAGRDPAAGATSVATPENHPSVVGSTRRRPFAR
jgi:hypothetical protein